MAVYAIGDVQGCYAGLSRLLEAIKFNESEDYLWFCGDLVNRGPDSLGTLRFIKSLGSRAIVVLGNHDLHLLATYHKNVPINPTDTLYDLLNSHDCDDLMRWLQSRPLIHFDRQLGKVLVHAGIHPNWSLDEAISYAGEVESVLTSTRSADFFDRMYGDLPDHWSNELRGMDRLRCITNIFTRMRFLTSDDGIDMNAKGSPSQHTQLRPWYGLGNRLDDEFNIIFGHWSTLRVGRYGQHFATDAGCVWGGKFVALRIDSNKFEWTSIDCGH